MRKTKKGFTIVELVIVIAVIGVLSAVLVPTFVNLTSKAQESADKSLVSNLNTSLKMSEASTDAKPRTMSEMLGILSEQGYQVSQLSTKGDSDLLYSLPENQFYLSSDEKVAADESKYHYWKIYEEVPDYGSQTYSIYLNNASLDTEVRVQVGFDMGANTSVPLVTYEHDFSEVRKVVINTNGGDLAIDAPHDTVYHYGSSADVTISHISSSSYFAFADSSFVDISSGRIVVEPEAEIDGLFVKDNGVIIAKANDAELPKVSRSDSVTSLKVQTTNALGQANRESTIEISGSEVTSTGNVPSSVLSSVESGLSSSANEEEARLATKYDCRIGAHVEGDLSNYYVSLQDALDVFATATAGVKVYLLRDVVVTSSLTIDATKYAHYLYLQGNSIIGEGCTPLEVTTLKKAFTISGGSLIGDATHPCLVNAAAYELILTSVDTVGGFVNNAASQYVVINNGSHTSCSFLGANYRLDTPNANALYDCDITSLVNPFRNVVTDNGNGTYSLRRVTSEEQTANGWTKVCDATLKTVEKYDTIAHYIQYADRLALSVILYANITEDVNNTTVNKALTINANKKTFTGKLITKAGLTLNSGSATGTFNISEIGCTTLAINNYAKVTVSGGAVSKTTSITGTGTTVTLNGATFTGTITVAQNKTNKLNVNGGTYKGSLKLGTTAGTSFSITVCGGNYLNKTVYKTFSSYIDTDSYTGQKNSDGTYSVVPKA